MKLPDRLVLLRYMGSIVLVFGYFILLNVDVFWGVCLRIIANCLSFPWALKNKVWDFVALLVFFLVIEIAKFIELVSS
jgi:hypothetical protein